MLFKQFEAKGLSHYSYVIANTATSEMVVIDPERDIQTYIAYAAENRLRIRYITETHIHADYASGALELAKKTGAELMLSGYDKGEKYEYAFAHTVLKEGDKIDLGAIRLEVLHTPGHTPEHISFLVFDQERSESEPIMFLTGDFLFVGSVGRPDLLGEEQKNELAKKLYHSVHKKLKNLHDGLEIYPAHGAGSLCGAGMGSAVSTTLGLERETNPYLRPMNEEAFVEKILSSSPPFPDYYLRMKQINSEGPAILEGLPKAEPVGATDLVKIIGQDISLLDLRHPLSFGGGHIEGAINIGSTDQISAWGPWILSYEKPIYLILEREESLKEALQQLIRVGLDDVKGYLRPNFNSWVNRGNDFSDLPQLSVHALTDFLEIGEAVTILDVRSESEYNQGHIKGARHIYLGDLPKKFSKLKNKEETIACVCGGGFRSSIACSFLMQQGYDNVFNVFGGMNAWKAAGYPEKKEKVLESVES